MIQESTTGKVRAALSDGRIVVALDDSDRTLICGRTAALDRLSIVVGDAVRLRENADATGTIFFRFPPGGVEASAPSADDSWTRQHYIAAGLIRPGVGDLPVPPLDVPTLRMDDAGRAVAAERVRMGGEDRDFFHVSHLPGKGVSR